MVTQDALRIDDADSMNAVRFIFFSLESMAAYGQTILEPNFQRPNRSFMELTPDLRFIPHMHQAYLHYGEKQFAQDPRFIPGTSGPNYWGGHRNFLVDSIQQLYLAGGEDNLELAKEFFFYLREFDRDEQGNIKARYQQTFERFVFQDMFEDLDTQKRAQYFIAQLLHRSLKDAAAGDIDSAIAHTEEAKKWWTYYMRDKQETERNDRRRLEPLGIMRRDVALVFMVRPDISLLQKARLWRALDVPTRQAIYDETREAIVERSAQHDPPYDPDKVMPEPPGMEEYRKNPDRVLKELEIYDEAVFEGEKIREL